MHTLSPLLPWLAAIRLPGIGPVAIQQWLNAMGDLNQLFTATHSELENSGLTPKQIAAIQKPDWTGAEKDLAWCEKTSCHILTIKDPHYPRYLKESHGAPAVLFVQGDLATLQNPALAIVGSRNPTPAGKEIAAQLATQLSKAGLTIASGLAIGIDTASHHGAINAQGKTIAVLGSGFQHIYPASNRHLAEKITQQGALITEFPPNTKAHASHFPRRNRIISGLSLGVLVIEAALKSGSLITARYANEQGREVFAVPGPISQPLSRGCHQLIRQGAKLVESAQDVIEELSPHLTPGISIKETATPQQTPPIDEKMNTFMAQMGYEVTSFDAIMQRSGLTAGEVSSMLLTLELQGCIKTAQGGYQLLIK